MSDATLFESARKPIERDRLKNRRYHESIEFSHGGLRYIAGVGFYKDGRVAEIFLTCGKAGSLAESMARDAAILISVSLQCGVALADLRRTLTRDAREAALGPVGALLDLLATTTPIGKLAEVGE